MNTERWCIAYHEAGHAVLGWYAGIPAKKLAIEAVQSDEHYLGGYVEPKQSGQLLIELKKDCFVSCIATEEQQAEIGGLGDLDPIVLLNLGGAAAQIIWDTEYLTDPWGSSTLDRQHAADIAGPISETDWMLLVQRGVQMLKVPVAWERVERVATALHKRGKLGQNALLRAIVGEY